MAQTAYFEYSCTSAPVVISYTQNGANCMETCRPLVGVQYKYVSSMCPATQQIYLSNWQRHYVVKETFQASADCSGHVLESFAVAADVLCHPLGVDDKSFVQVNCNGGNPVWKTCKDSQCTKNCTIDSGINQQCTVTGASASQRMRCHMPRDSKTPDSKDPDTSGDTNVDPGALNNAGVLVTGCTWLTMLWLWALCQM